MEVLILITTLICVLVISMMCCCFLLNSHHHRDLFRKKHRPLIIRTPLLSFPPHSDMAEDDENITYYEEFILNSRGDKLFTCRWIPKNTPPKALVFVCHGYAVECSITMRETFTRLAQAGYAVYGLDYFGHGKSSGLQGYIANFDDLIGDCSAFFTGVCEREENRNKQRYLLGESMGGAVALLLHRKHPSFWHGAVFVAPMCKIADEMKPSALLIPLLSTFARIIPTWSVVPTNDITDVANKTPQKRLEIRNNPYCYKGRPRLKSAQEMLDVTLDLEKNLHQVSLPFFIVHGGDDKVSDPAISRLLYESAASTDKKFKLYPGMWHAITSAEPPENLNLVFHDIIVWLDERSTAAAPDRLPEIERKKAKRDNLGLSSKY